MNRREGKTYGTSVEASVPVVGYKNKSEPHKKMIRIAAANSSSKIIFQPSVRSACMLLVWLSVPTLKMYKLQQQKNLDVLPVMELLEFPNLFMLNL